MDLYFARELYEMAVNGSDMELDQLEYVSVEGWVRTNRDNGQVGFIELNDGSYFKNIQIVYGPELDNHNEVSHLLTGSSIVETTSTSDLIMPSGSTKCSLVKLTMPFTPSSCSSLTISCAPEGMHRIAISQPFGNFSFSCEIW